jgi:hypothetical protein
MCLLCPRYIQLDKKTNHIILHVCDTMFVTCSTSHAKIIISEWTNVTRRRKGVQFIRQPSEFIDSHRENITSCCEVSQDVVDASVPL